MWLRHGEPCCHRRLHTQAGAAAGAPQIAEELLSHREVGGRHLLLLHLHVRRACEHNALGARVLERVRVRGALARARHLARCRAALGERPSPAPRLVTLAAPAPNQPRQASVRQYARFGSQAGQRRPSGVGKTGRR